MYHRHPGDKKLQQKILPLVEGPDGVAADVADLITGFADARPDEAERSLVKLDATLEYHSKLFSRLGEFVRLGGEVVATDVFDFLLTTRDSFDLVFVDPPYDLALASVEEVLEHLVNLINPNAIVMVHRRAGDDSPVPPDGLVLVWQREYGDARVMRFTPAEDESR